MCVGLNKAIGMYIQIAHWADKLVTEVLGGNAFNNFYKV